MKRTANVGLFMPKRICMWLAIALSVAVTSISCSKDDMSGAGKIAGTWVDSGKGMVMTLGKDGSYRLDYNSSYGLYLIGSYSYNPLQQLMVVNFKATEFNYAYQQTYIVQTLTSSTLVLMYTDGDVEGYYTRK